MTDGEFLVNLVPRIPSTPPEEKISSWVEGRRILPTSSPFPGPWRNERTPYGVEWMNNLSPYSPVSFTAILKARKVGASTIMENCIAYWMGENPTKQLYTTATESLAKEFAEVKLPPLIDSMGLRDRITANITSAKSRRSGDTSNRKEYIGGELDIMSSQSKQAQRALDKRCLFIDEVDGLAPLTKTGEGLWTEVLFGATASWAERKKISMFSSPSTIEESLIWKYYRAGDCRQFLIPCPCCGEHIPLEMDGEKRNHGLKAVTQGGKIIDAVYICPSCGGEIQNGDKEIFYGPEPYCRKQPGKKLPPAYWKPTRQNNDPAYRSYQINALYSPIGMVSFKECALKQAEAETAGADQMRSFMNIFCGLPYRDFGKRPRLAKVMDHRGDYSRGTVPEGVLFLTAAVDVQQGEKDNPGKPERLEMEVCGVGLGYRNWSVEYKVFEGSTIDPYEGAWEDLFQYMKSIDGTFYGKNRIPLRIQMIFIDSGDASRTKDGVSRSDVVTRFCERWHPIAYPIKGFQQLKARSGETPDVDQPGARDFKRYRRAMVGTGGEYLIEISTNYYKNILFSRLSIEKTERNPNPAGYLEFPADYPDEYFRQLTNIERLSDGSYRDRGAVEAADLKIYNLACQDAWLDYQVTLAKDKRLRAGVNPVVVNATTNSRLVLEHLQAEIAAFGAAQDTRHPEGSG